MSNSTYSIFTYGFYKLLLKCWWLYSIYVAYYSGWLIQALTLVAIFLIQLLIFQIIAIKINENQKTKNNNIIANLYNFFTRIEYSDKYENVTKPAMFKVLKVVTIAEDVTLISFFLVIYFDLFYKNYNENVFYCNGIFAEIPENGGMVCYQSYENAENETIQNLVSLIHFRPATECLEIDTSKSYCQNKNFCDKTYVLPEILSKTSFYGWPSLQTYVEINILVYLIDLALLIIFQVKLFYKETLRLFADIYFDQDDEIFTESKKVGITRTSTMRNNDLRVQLQVQQQHQQQQKKNEDYSFSASTRHTTLNRKTTNRSLLKSVTRSKYCWTHMISYVNYILVPIIFILANFFIIQSANKLEKWCYNNLDFFRNSRPNIINSCQPSDDSSSESDDSENLIFETLQETYKIVKFLPVAIFLIVSLLITSITTSLLLQKKGFKILAAVFLFILTTIGLPIGKYFQQDAKTCYFRGRVDNINSISVFPDKNSENQVKNCQNELKILWTTYLICYLIFTILNLALFYKKEDELDRTHRMIEQRDSQDSDQDFNPFQINVEQGHAENNPDISQVSIVSSNWQGTLNVNRESGFSGSMSKSFLRKSKRDSSFLELEEMVKNGQWPL